VSDLGEIIAKYSGVREMADRIRALEAALSEATWLLREDVPDDPPVTEDEHYARKAAWNEALTSLGIPTDCYAAETSVKPLNDFSTPTADINAKGFIDPRPDFKTFEVRQAWHCGECNHLNEAKDEFCFECGESEANRAGVK
jgi:hypothetical protein